MEGNQGTHEETHIGRENIDTERPQSDDRFKPKTDCANPCNALLIDYLKTGAQVFHYSSLFAILVQKKVIRVHWSFLIDRLSSQCQSEIASSAIYLYTFISCCLVKSTLNCVSIAIDQNDWLEKGLRSRLKLPNESVHSDSCRSEEKPKDLS